MTSKIKEGINVWHNDFGYNVLEIRGDTAHIQELDGSSMGRNYIRGIDDIWVSIAELEPFSEEDYEEYS